MLQRIPTHEVPPEPMTFVHAGPTLLEEPSLVGSLRHYLRRCDDDEQRVLLHAGQPALHAVAEQLDVPEIAIDTEDARLGVDREVSELALELGASSIEFAIDRPALGRPGGRPIRSLTAREAERFARTAALPERIRCKLLAAAAGVRHGLEKARIGAPFALMRDLATVIRPDAAVQVGLAMPDPANPPAARSDAVARATPGPRAGEKDVAERSSRRVVAASPVERAVVFG